MNNGKICIPVCTSDVKHFPDQVKSASKLADLVEMRLDCFRNIPDLSELTAGPETIVTLRPREQGGQADLTREQRIGFWSDFSLDCGVDVEAELSESVPENVHPKICSYHDFTGSLSDVDRVYDRLSATTADILKIAVATKDAIDAIEIWRLLFRAKAESREIIPIAMGEAGKWTRILGLAHGAYLTYATLENGEETAPGQITAHDMIDVFRVKELDKQTDVYGIIAGDTSYTMSPYIHNSAFKSERMNAVFVPFQATGLEAFITRMVRAETREVELNFRGFSVTNPHKQAIIKYLDNVDDAAAKIGAVNTIKIIDGKLHGYNTDAHGFAAPLRDRFDVKNSRTAVIGAGGASRSCIYALKNAGAHVTVFARDVKKAELLAQDFGISVKNLENGNSKLKTSFSEFDIVVNSTPVGTRGENINETVATAEQLNGVKIVYDLVYNPIETLLLHEAKKAGAKTIGGFDMLIAQAQEQFRIWTGRNAPVEAMSTAARKRLYDR